MKIQSIIEISKREEALTRDPKGFLEYRLRNAAAEMGVHIAEKIPYEKDRERSWPEGRPLPTLLGSSSIQESDYYRCEFVILNKRDWQSLEDAVRALVYDAAIGATKPHQVVKEILQTLDYYCSPEE